MPDELYTGGQLLLAILIALACGVVIGHWMWA